MRDIWKIIWLYGCLFVVGKGCIPVRVTRTSTNQVTDLSGRWNDTDSRLVADNMLKELITSPWLIRLEQAHLAQAHLTPSVGNVESESRSHHKPVLIVGTILNKSHEHIEPETFIKDLERGLLREGKMRIVANSTFREKLREARVKQHPFVDPETQKRLGHELGADYMLFGTINTIVDTEGANQVVFYQINLELAHLETNELVWVGEKKIKKYRGRGKKIKRKYQGVTY